MRRAPVSGTVSIVPETRGTSGRSAFRKRTRWCSFAYSRAEAVVPGGAVTVSEPRCGTVRLEIPNLDGRASDRLRDVAEAAMAALSDAGYVKLDA